MTGGTTTGGTTTGGTTTGSTGIAILVVDDDDAGRYLKTLLLTRAGYTVATAAFGEEALRIVDNTEPALVLLDVKLPDINGIEVCRRIKASRPATMVLQTSAAFTGRQDRAQGLEGGADSYLVEPIEPAELLAAVRALLRLAASERALRAANIALTRQLDERSREVVVTHEKLESEAQGRAKAEEMLRHTQKLDVLGQLTGGIAHDFNNLLTVILGNLETLQRQFRKPEPDRRKAERAAENAFRGAQRAAAITQRLLAFSRRDSLNPKVVDVAALLANTAALLRRTVDEGIEIVVEAPATLWPLRVDPTHFESAMLNVALNARDAMPKGGTITITAGNRDHGGGDGLPAGHYVGISVTDTGTGMSESVRQYAFEPFFTTKGIGHGTGLGLAQVYGFVTQSGGEVKLASAPGAGTTVHIALPALPETALEMEGAASAEAAPHAGGAHTVLVVEDDADVRAHSCEVLAELGYRVLAAGNGREALARLAEEPAVDLLFTDIGLPGGMNGHQLAAAARRERPDLDVLFTTGYGKDTMILPEGAGDAPAIITKPFAYPALARKIHAMIAARAAGRAAPPSPNSPGPRTIMVVDDEILVRMSAVDTLESLGFEVAESGSAAEAMRCFRDNGERIGAAVIDIGLPDRTGDVLMTELRALRPALPVVFVSGYDAATLRARIGDAAAVEVVNKPYTSAELADALSRLGVAMPAAR